MVARAGRNDSRNIVLFDQHKTKVGLHFEQVVFVGDDHAVEFLAVLESDFIGVRAWRGEHGDTDGEAAKNQPSGKHVCEYAAGPRKGQPLAGRELSVTARRGVLCRHFKQAGAGGRKGRHEKVPYRKMAGSIQRRR
jgi:hypothetical protein